MHTTNSQRPTVPRVESRSVPLGEAGGGRSPAESFPPTLLPFYPPSLTAEWKGRKGWEGCTERPPLPVSSVQSYV